MQYDVYSIRDAKVGFGALMMDSNSDSAIRNFAMSCSSGMLRFAIDDYALFKVGAFDLASGIFDPLTAPEFVISGRDALRRYSKEV